MTHNVHAPSIENIEMQDDQFDELSPEELEMASGGDFWRVIADLIKRVCPTAPPLISAL